MALAIDASSPPTVTQTSGSVATVTTASFTPPAGALLLVLWSANTSNLVGPSAPSITDSLGVHLAYGSPIDWESFVDSSINGQAASWSALVGSSAAMTVTVTTGTASTSVRQAALTVLVLTGQHATPIGAHGKATSFSATSIAQAYTAQATGGQGFIGVCDWDALAGGETAGTGCTLISAGTIPTNQISYGFVRRTTADDVNGVSNTLNVTLPGTSANLSWVYVEVVPAGAAAGTLPGAPIGQGARPIRRQAGQSYVTRSVSDPPPAGPIPLVVNTAAGTNWPRTGSAVIIRPPAEPYLDPPGWRQQPATPTPAPRTGSALVIAPRTDVAAAPDIPPVPIVDTIRTPTPTVVGSATVTRSTAEPDFPPAPVVEVSRAATPPPWAPTATVTSSRVDPAAVVDFPPAPIVEMSRPNLGPPMAGTATTTRPVADPAAAPIAPTPVVLVARTATGPSVAPAAVIVHSTADPIPDARPPIVITTIGMPAETLGWSILTRPITDPPQPTITPTIISTPTRTPIRIGTAAVGVPRTDPPLPFVPILIGLDGSATAGTVEGAATGHTVEGAAPQPATLDGTGAQPSIVGSTTTSTGSVS